MRSIVVDPANNVLEGESLSLAEEGCLRRLLDRYALSEVPFIASEINLIAKRIQARPAMVDKILRQFFTLEKGKFHHQKLDAQIIKARHRSQIMAEIGEKGGKSKTKQTKRNQSLTSNSRVKNSSTEKNIQQKQRVVSGTLDKTPRDIEQNQSLTSNSRVKNSSTEKNIQQKQRVVSGTLDKTPRDIEQNQSLTSNSRVKNPSTEKNIQQKQRVVSGTLDKTPRDIEQNQSLTSNSRVKNSSTEKNIQQKQRVVSGTLDKTPRDIEQNQSLTSNSRVKNPSTEKNIQQKQRVVSGTLDKTPRDIEQNQSLTSNSRVKNSSTEKNIQQKQRVVSGTLDKNSPPEHVTNQTEKQTQRLNDNKETNRPPIDIYYNINISPDSNNIPGIVLYSGGVVGGEEKNLFGEFASQIPPPKNTKTAKPPKPPKPPRPTIDNFAPNDAHHALAAELGLDADAVAGQFTMFVDYCLANGVIYKNYDAAFRNWLRRSISYGARNHARNPIRRDAIGNTATGHYGPAVSDL